MKNDILFSHRPKTGVSVGVLSENGRLFVALALTNDGWSSNRRFNKERKDAFSRSRSRSIIMGRIRAMKTEGTPSNFNLDGFSGGSQDRFLGFFFTTDKSSGEFMHLLREWFKPKNPVTGVPDESDTTFSLVDSESGNVLLERLDGNDIAYRVYEKAVSILHQLDGARV